MSEMEGVTTNSKTYIVLNNIDNLNKSHHDQGLLLFYTDRV